ncbi:hypothetical protein ABTL84_19130, partial [Acinetobacter baumannii]
IINAATQRTDLVVVIDANDQSLTQGRIPSKRVDKVVDIRVAPHVSGDTYQIGSIVRVSVDPTDGLTFFFCALNFPFLTA